MTAILYTLFAALSTGVNIGLQAVSFALYTGPGALYLAMAAGTMAGLVTKYVLDKKWIFRHVPQDRTDDLRKFLLYSCMGVCTTLIFWITEALFDHLWHHPQAKYAGALLGLSAGYVTKYFLDRRYVFINRKETA